MKTTVNKIRLALLLGFITICMTAQAQAVPYINKMSITTQLFMEEMAGNISFDHDVPPTKSADPKAKPLPRPLRLFVNPDTISGQIYIASTVRITSDSDIADLESKGVIIQYKFDNGLLTTLIPVDRIEEVATIEGVKRINVSPYMRPMTNLARQATNVDDVLTLSQDARDAGLLKKYDGSGVILGIIDVGIDYRHPAFTDKNGNTRIKGAYCYSSSGTTDWYGSGNLPTYDTNSEDHGTHTSSIAGGSSVRVSGTTVTVTDDHATANYGGMAPGADLYLAGTQLSTNAILNSFFRMNEYADITGQPLVVSNSWGSYWGARDGFTDVSDVINQYFGDNHPDRICLFASGNEAGKANGGVGGGRYVTGTATQASPLGTIIRSESYIESYGIQYYPNILANAWTRGTNCNGIGINLYVLNKSNGTIRSTYNYTSTNNNSQNLITLSDFNWRIYVLFDYADAAPGRHQVMLYCENYVSTSNYVLAFEVYPIGGNNNIVDIYAGDFTYLTGNLNTDGHQWQYGTDDMSTGDEATNPNVISVGSYVTRNGTYPTGDISDFSSYAVEGSGPTGQMHPWITAPGEVIISALNHYVSYNNHEGPVTVNNTNAPYGEMSGTSMATPAAAGIVALWMEAAREVGKTMTTSDIREVMKQTAIHDSWTDTGTHASHFGNGKINALAGIEYILAQSSQPIIIASPSDVTFEQEPGTTTTQTVAVAGRNLTAGINATLNDPSGVYSINPNSFGTDGGDMVITYSPTAEGYHNATVTLTSPDADPVTVTINGTSRVVREVTVANGTVSNNTLPVYGANFNRTQTNQMLYQSSKFTNSGMNGKTIKKITFYPTSYGNINGINFRRANNQSGQVTIKLANMPSGTAAYANNNPAAKTATFTTVKTIQMPTTAQTGATEWVFEDLDNDFVYDGGDLLIEVTTTTGTAGDTYFAGENQSTRQGYYSYVRNNTTTRTSTNFLPKVTFEWDVDAEPVTAGTVNPQSLTFDSTPIGQEASQTITVSNTGNQPFVPTIDTTNLPSEFTVTGNGQILPGGSIDLTVTYNPSDEGPHSGSFTITIGDETFTVTVTGSGYRVISTLTSNEVMVPVFKSEIQGIDALAYSVTQIDNDIDHELPSSDAGGDVSVQVVGNDAITYYELKRQNNGSDWDVVAIANHNGNDYTQPNHAENSVTVADGATAWMNLIDDVGITSPDVTYVPVTHANGVISQDNTYGAPHQDMVKSSMNAVIQSIVMSSEHAGGSTWTENGKIYTHYTILLNINQLTIPTSATDPTKDYDLYKVRAWRQVDPALLNERYYEASTGNAGKNREERLTQNGDFMFEELNYSQYSLISVNNLENQYFLGDNDNLTSFYPNWTSPGTEEVMATFGAQKLRESEDETGVIESLPMTFTVRAYYTRTANLNINGTGNRDEIADGKYYILEYVLPLTLSADDPQIVTAVGSTFADRQVINVTYVNAMGMQSSEPFDGLNIVVTRYSDGTVSTVKVLK